MTKAATLIAVGRYARLSRMARTDCIGQVTHHRGGNVVTVRVPNWQADGWHRDFDVHADELERATATECRAAAKAR